MIEVNGVVKRFGATLAVDGVSFRVEKGEILGFLGPNGAGKTTTMKVLTTYLVPDEGDAKLLGRDVVGEAFEVRKLVGYLPESVPLYNDMRAEDYLHFVARARQIPRSEQKGRVCRAAELAGLEGMLKKNCGELSRGYRQRVGLAQALIHDPPVLILDEPTTGLDPHQIIEIRDVIRRIGREKATVFSTHIMQEVSAVCTRIIIIKEGRLIADGTAEELRRKAGGGQSFRGRIQAPGDVVADKLRAIAGISEIHVRPEGDGWAAFTFRTSGDGDPGAEVYRMARDNGWTLAEIASADLSLEDVYLQLTRG